MGKEFVERRDGSFYLTGSRVPLAHIVRQFQHGEFRKPFDRTIQH